MTRSTSYMKIFALPCGPKIVSLSFFSTYFVVPSISVIGWNYLVLFLFLDLYNLYLVNINFKVLIEYGLGHMDSICWRRIFLGLLEISLIVKFGAVEVRIFSMSQKSKLQWSNRCVHIWFTFHTSPTVWARLHRLWEKLGRHAKVVVAESLQLRPWSPILRPRKSNRILESFDWPLRIRSGPYFWRLPHRPPSSKPYERWRPHLPPSLSSISLSLITLQRSLISWLTSVMQ